MPNLQELEAQRQSQMDKLAELLDRKQRYTNYQHQNELDEIKRLQEARRDSDLRYGDELAQGAASGYMLSGGNPIGAAVGAGVGALAGGKKAYDRRREEGKGRLESFFGTLLDVPNMIPGMDTTTQLLPGAAAAAEGKRARNERTETMDALKSLQQQQPQQPGSQQIWPGASPGFEPWKYQDPAKYRGSI